MLCFFHQMAQANIPQSLPFLPGMSYADPKITRYHKTQLLGVKDGIITGKHKFCLTPVNGSNLGVTFTCL